MDLGSGLAIAIPGGMGFIGLFGYLITIVKTKGNTTDNVDNNKTMRRLDHGEGCPLHPALSKLVEETREDVKEIRSNVTEILLRVSS